MILEKELTIKELKHIIKELEDDLELYLTLKKINFEKTQPGATKFKDIVTSKPTSTSDRFAQYMIKDEQYDETIFAKHQSLLAYEQRYLEKIKNMKSSSEKEFITFLREEEKLSWEEISRITYYSERQCRRIYGLK